jgi:hypothetical protein
MILRFSPVELENLYRVLPALPGADDFGFGGNWFTAIELDGHAALLTLS